MQFAEVNDIVVHYHFEAASAGQPTLVFINSLGSDFRIWDDVRAALSGNVGLLFYDKRGHGLSLATAAPYKWHDHAGDLAALLDHLSIDRAIVCGLSVGGLIAQGLYQLRPELVEALMFCDTGYKLGDPELWNTRITQCEGEGLASMADGILARWFSEEFRNSRPAELSGYRTMLCQQSVAGYAGTCAVLRDTDFTDMAGNISVPTLCVVGSEDLATPPEVVKALADKIPGAAYEIIEGSGHLPCVDQPEAFLALMNSFLNEVRHG